MEELNVENLIAMYQAANPAIDETVLSGMNAIDWSMINDCYGPANEIPALLRAALSDNKDHRDFAFHLLHQTVWHQGSIYEASSFVVPLLQSMLVSPQTPDKGAVAFLIACLATGYSESVKWINKTRDAVSIKLPLLYRFLEDNDETMRDTIGEMLGLYPDYAGETIPLLEKAFSVEKDDRCKNTIEKSIKHLQGK